MSFFNKYDKITLLVNKILTINHNLEYGITTDSDGAIQQLRYSDTGISVVTDYLKNNTRITFSSKILKGKASQLISTENIEEVHRLITDKLVISHHELMQATVIKAEITLDVRFHEPDVLIKSLYDLAKLQTGYKVSPKLHKSGKKACSFWMKKNNNSSKYIDYLSIYDKRVEFQSQDNRANQEFMQSLSNEELSDYLKQIKNIVRFEVKLHSAYMLRKHLELHDKATPTLEALLNSEVQVVKNMVVRIFSGLSILTQKEFKAKNRAQLADYLALQANDFNLEKTLIYLQNMFGKIQRSREEKRLREVIASMDAFQISALVLLYIELLKLI